MTDTDLTDRDYEITRVREDLTTALADLEAAAARARHAIAELVRLYDVEIAENHLVAPAVTQVELSIAALHHVILDPMTPNDVILDALDAFSQHFIQVLAWVLLVPAAAALLYAVLDMLTVKVGKSGFFSRVFDGVAYGFVKIGRGAARTVRFCARYPRAVSASGTARDARNLGMVSNEEFGRYTREMWQWCTGDCHSEPVLAHAHDLAGRAPAVRRRLVQVPAEPDGTLFIECACGHPAAMHTTSDSGYNCQHTRQSVRCTCAATRAEVIASGRGTPHWGAPQDVPAGLHPTDKTGVTE